MPFRNVVKKIANKVPYAATVADYLGHQLDRARRPSTESDQNNDIIKTIYQRGYYIINDFFTASQCTQCIDDFESMLASKSHYVQQYSDLRVFGAEELSPMIKEFSEHSFLTDISLSYMDRNTVNAFTLANKVENREGSIGSGEGWHKDRSFRQFKAIMYLNDVDLSCGPFQVIAESHKLANYLDNMHSASLPFRQLRITEEQMSGILETNSDKLITVTGRKGTLILVDTACIHRGAPPKGGVRYALTNYYIEREQITPEYVKIYSPVNPEKTLGKRL